MNICIELFSASIALAGFIAVFLVFRYKTIDTYVDNRKAILRSLLKDQIEKAPCIAVIIQEIGKKPQENDACSFCELINKELAKEKAGELANQTKKAVITFFNDILEYRRMRKRTVCRGLTSIVIWGALSLIYLLIYAIGPCLFNSISCSAMVIGISIGFFISSMVFTLYFVSKSLCAKRPE
jgi:hypothetical protein